MNKQAQESMIAALLESADNETRAMFARLVDAKRRQLACGHRDGWLYVETAHAVCQSCGLLALRGDVERLIRWPEPTIEEPAQALGTELAAWSAPHG
jgi:hypothetical protein